MKWERVSATYFRAVGAIGTFTIRRKSRKFWAEYKSYSGGFKLPPKNRLSEAKAMCEENFYWEGI